MTACAGVYSSQTKKIRNTNTNTNDDKYKTKQRQLAQVHILPRENQQQSHEQAVNMAAAAAKVSTFIWELSFEEVWSFLYQFLFESWALKKFDQLVIGFYLKIEPWMGFTFTAKSAIDDAIARVMCRPVSSLVWGTDKEWWSSKVGKAQSVPAPWKLRQGDFYGLVAEMSRWKMVLNGVDKGFIHPNQPERAPLAIYRPARATNSCRQKVNRIYFANGQ